MFEIPVIDGRAYNETDGGFAEKFILNEAAAKKYNVKAGDKIHVFDVVGIVKNFHYHSLHRPVEPVFIAHQDQNYPYLLVKTNGRNKEVIEFARELFQEVSPSYYMEYELLDDRIIDFYKKEEKQMGTIGFFSAIALALSIMGLLGFVALNLIKRTKEIGVRKINGANISELLKMMNYQYLKWIAIAFIIACPLGYFAINKWLENFAYKTTLSWWVFALAGIIALGIALITVSWQSWRAATRNPVEALRYE
jgi:putative ABC transport system permease protein